VDLVEATQTFHNHYVVALIFFCSQQQQPAAASREKTKSRAAASSSQQRENKIRKKLKNIVCVYKSFQLHFSCFFSFFIFQRNPQQININSLARQGLYILRDRTCDSSKLLYTSFKLLLVRTKLKIVIIALLIDCIY
jgi:hypothetical protein